MQLRPSRNAAQTDDGHERLALGLITVLLLSCFAGAVDACGLTILKDLFVSFMSGNTTSLGVAIGRWDVPRMILILSIVSTFVAGAAAGTVLAVLAGRNRLPIVVFAVALLLVIPVLVESAAVYAMTFAMGALNAAMDRAGDVSVSVTYVTGTLVKFGRGLGETICGGSREIVWVEQAVPWIGLLVGAATAALCLTAFGHAMIIALPVVGFVLALTFWLFPASRNKGSA